MKRQYMDELVSVITPVYNSERYIAGTIDSAMAQTYENIEMILVDDCSIDRTAEIIKGMQKKYGEKIVYYKLEKNSGAGIARNKALDIARGQYVAFLDGDDLWYPQKVQKQVELLKENHAGFSFAAIEMIDEENYQVKPKRKVKEKIDYKFLLKNTMIATSSVLIDRKITGDFYMELRRSGQDYATWLMLLRDGMKAYGINETLVKYRRTPNSLSSKKTRNIKKVWNIQVHSEHIHPVKATVNSLCYAANAVRKYFF